MRFGPMKFFVSAWLGTRMPLQCLTLARKLVPRQVLAALVPKPRVNLTRFHGVFAPHSRLRSRVTPGGRARRCRGDTVESASERRAAMSV